MKKKTILNLGMLGLGEVGSGVYSILTQKRRYFAEEIGVEFHFKKIAVRSASKKRKVRVPKGVLCTDPMQVIDDPSIDVVVELMGGTRDAFNWVTKALKAGKHVVTANKALLAERGDEIFALSSKMKRWVFFEASVGGGIPVIKALRESLVANHIDSIQAIINGTSNYILTKMTSEGSDFHAALKRAQEKGYAEADPTLDINGMDAAHKLAILARFGFRGKISLDDIYCEGIQRIRAEDIDFANEFGYRIKLLAVATLSTAGVAARVQPTLLHKNHILANVRGSFNAVMLRGDKVGDVLLFGRGAGSFPTASAVVSDLVDIAKRFDHLGSDALVMRSDKRHLKIKKKSSVLSRYYLRFHVVDQPGVLSRITQILGRNRISISDCIQEERRRGGVVPLIMLTHDVLERHVVNAVDEINKLRVVRGKPQVIPIQDETQE